MATSNMSIEYPQFNIKYFAIQPVYLKSDTSSINQYCTDNGYTYISHKTERQRFSNDGGLTYQYWGLPMGVTGGTSQWVTEFGYSQIVTELTVS